MARQRLPSLNARIRTRRSQLGLTGAELAQRAGISASYVSLIEKGAKVPDVDVAAGLARALDDEEDLYRAWARAARLGLHDLDPLHRLEVISRTPAYVSLVESGQALPRLDSTPAPSGRWDEDLRSRLREVASRLTSFPATGELAPLDEPESSPSSPPAPQPASGSTPDASVERDIIRVPVLAEGADPARLGVSSSSAAIREQMLVDRRLVDGHERGRLFAYDVTPGAMKHLRGVAAPGDRIVFRHGGHVAPDRICALRTGPGIVLARVLLRGRSLLLLPGDGEPDFETVDVRDPKALPEVIVGTHILLIRR